MQETPGQEGTAARAGEATSSASAGGRRSRPDTGDAGGAGYDAHASALVEDGASIGERTTIGHFSHISDGATIGRDCSIAQNVEVGPGVRIGDGVEIQNNVSVYEGVTLEDHVFCGPSMVFTNVHNPRSEIRRMDEVRPTHVHRGATFGANCTVLCGIEVGEYGFVGAGAVVTKDVPAYGLVVGNPAHLVGWMCRCGKRIRFADGEAEGSCGECGRAYWREDERTIVPGDCPA